MLTFSINNKTYSDLELESRVKLNILIVEDEIVSMKYLQEILAEIEFLEIENIYKARDAEVAFDIVKNNSVDLIFMDINIQGSIDGITCAKEINIQNSTIPIVFTTAYNDSQTILEASESNMIGYLIKPFNITAVKVPVTIAIKERKKYRETTSIQLNQTSDEVSLEEYIYDTKQKVIYKEDKVIKLSDKEVQCFDILYRNKNNFLSSETLCAQLWSEERTNPQSSARELVYRLRNKLSGLNIVNIPNMGYCLKL